MKREDTIFTILLPEDNPTDVFMTRESLSTPIPKSGLIFARHFRHSGGSRNPGFSIARKVELDPGFCRGDDAGDGIVLESTALP